jgi:Skp family chaperone for outer membrane proteins
MLLYLIPVFVLAFLLLVMGTLAALSRVAGGKYLRPVFAFLGRVPLVRDLIRKASEKAIERYNPELAGAMKKLQRAGADKDPQRAQQALSTLSAEERKAWMEAASQQGALEQQQPINRAQRRAMERMQKGRMPSPQVKRRAK